MAQVATDRPGDRMGDREGDRAGGGTAAPMTYDGWAGALKEEVVFWRNRLKRVDDAIKYRLDVHNKPLPKYIKDAIPADAADPIRILDVGAGPMTYLPHSWPGRKVELVPVDILADEYNSILDEYGLKPPVRTRKARFEDLAVIFRDGRFDFVNAGNCLDHCFDPVEAIRNCVTVLKAGRSMYAMHHIRVAEAEGYKGLHQWNLEPGGSDDVILSHRDIRHSLKAALGASVGAIRATRLDGDRFEFLVTKAL